MAKGKRGREPKVLNTVLEWIENGGKGTAEECAAAIWGDASPENQQKWRVINQTVKKRLRAEGIIWGLVKVNGYPGVYQKIDNPEKALRMLDFAKMDTIGRTFEAIKTLTITADQYPQVLQLAEPQVKNMMEAWMRAGVMLLDIKKREEDKENE